MYSFTKDNRLLTKYDFKSVLDNPRIKVATSGFVLFYSECKDQSSPGKRLGLIVSKKTGNAVKRNYIKRSIREYFRLNRDDISAGDYVALARPQLTQTETNQIQSQIRFSFEKLGDRLKKNKQINNDTLSIGEKSGTPQFAL